MTIQRIGTWLDEHALLVLSSFLLAFIPLVPKLPLFDAIPGYLVRVRTEDFVVLFTVMVWGIQVLRKKIEWKTPLTFAVLLYAVIGLFSTISGVLITQTIPAELLHIGKSMLHYFRYLEYFSLLFIVYAGIKTVRDLKIVLGVITITVLAISIYAVGQRFWYWPVYSTMNREFSKGIRLYLTEHARVQSTFGGHYDLAAYMVIISPILLAAFYLIKNRWVKVLLAVTLLISHWTLIVTASRASYIAFLVAMSTTMLLLAFVFNTKWSKGIVWTIKNAILLTVISIYMMFQFGDSMYERILQTLEAYPAAHEFYHSNNKKRKEITLELTDQFASSQIGTTLQSWFGDFPTAEPPENGMSLADAEVMVSSDTRPTAGTPSDVFVDVPVLEPVSTTSADGTVTTTMVEKPRDYSNAAQIYGLSFAIRLDTLWPRALKGFYTNPLLGTGYATLTKESLGQFTEAESTDNNFLRTLGETGLLGFISFYGIVVLSMIMAIQVYLEKDKDPLVSTFVIGFIAASIGLLINAFLIDVFAASKVAFTYWALAGIVMSIYTIKHESFFKFDFLHKQPVSQIAKKSRTKLK